MAKSESVRGTICIAAEVHKVNWRKSISKWKNKKICKEIIDRACTTKSYAGKQLHVIIKAMESH